MKKTWLKIGLTLVAWIFMCTTVSATTIEFWTTETQSDRMKTIQLLMDTFQALNPDITVKLVPVDENEMPSQMAAASAAGSLPGLIEGSSESSTGAVTPTIYKRRAWRSLPASRLLICSSGLTR